MNWDGRLPGGKGWVLGSERSRARAVVRGGLVLLAGLVTVAVAASILYGALGGLRPTRPMVGGVRGTPETGAGGARRTARSWKLVHSGRTEVLVGSGAGVGPG